MKKENMNFKTLDLAISDEIEGKVEAVFSVFNNFSFENFFPNFDMCNGK